MAEQHADAPPVPLYVPVAAPGSPRSTGLISVAGDLVTALTGTPVVLALLIVNCVFAGSAAWFLMAQEEFRHKERMAIITVMEKCMLPTAANSGRPPP